MRRRIRKRSLLLAAIFALATVPAPQLALCESADGHRALEVLGAACCPGDPVVDDHHETGTREDGCAEDCIDTPVGTGDALTAGSGKTSDGDILATNGSFSLASNILSAPRSLSLSNDYSWTPMRPASAARSAVRRL